MALKFNTKFSLTSFVNQVKKLSDDQREVIKKMGFGHLLLIPSQTLNKNMLVELMEKWNSKKKSFVLSPGEIKVTLMDVALILGLRVTGDPVVLKEDSPLSYLEKDYGVTIEKREITVSYLKRRLRSLKTMLNKDFIRSFLLFTFGTFLLPNALGTIDSRYLHLLEDMEKVPQFAWGKIVLKDLVKWMDRRKKDSEMQYMGSCLLFLQIWSYEHIDIARPRLLECHTTFPRACRWKNSSSRPSQWLAIKFQELHGDQMIWRLKLTSEESTIDIIKDILKIQNEEISSASHSSSTSDGNSDDDTSRDKFEPLDNKLVEIEDSEVVIISESLVVENDRMNISSTPECVSRIEETSINESQPLDKQLIKLVDREIVTISESLEVVDDKMDISFSSTPQFISRIDTAAYEDNLRAHIRVLEKQNTELRKEADELRTENRLLTEQKIELRKEADEWRTESELIRNRLLSSESLADRFERILNGEDVD